MPPTDWFACYLSAIFLRVAREKSSSSLSKPLTLPLSSTPIAYRASPSPSFNLHFICVIKCSKRLGDGFSNFNFKWKNKNQFINQAHKKNIQIGKISEKNGGENPYFIGRYNQFQTIGIHIDITQWICILPRYLKHWKFFFYISFEV